MAADAATDLVNRMIEEIQNRKNIALCGEFFAEGFVNHSAAPGMPAGRDGMRALFATVGGAFPDSKVTVLDQISDGRKVWTRKVFSGTHTGEFRGIAPTRNRVTYEVIDILAVEGGWITEHWSVLDRHDFMRQLGLVG